MNTLDHIRRGLDQRTPLLQKEGHNASVAAIIRPDNDDTQLLFIERARVDGDPWSGDIAFPGGRIEESDPTLRATAERETHEEIGLHLQGANYVGRLDDLQGSSLPVQVAAFVYFVENDVELDLNAEVHRAFWQSLHTLCDPNRHCQHLSRMSGEVRPMPAIDLLGPEHPLLWGITYRFTAQLTALLGNPLPAKAPVEGSTT
ncbi:MAG: 8-oxo-dGTP pyrophosphatase MutT (NUDIX family) [Candidatus Latescibacterota bacterium]|jgi:8-oxo-dGTP pyrophosphatase MutT (NUDIX family)